MVLGDLVRVQVDVDDLGAGREHVAQLGEDLGHDVGADDQVGVPLEMIGRLAGPNMWPVMPMYRGWRSSC